MNATMYCSRSNDFGAPGVSITTDPEDGTTMLEFSDKNFSRSLIVLSTQALPFIAELLLEAHRSEGEVKLTAQLPVTENE